MNIRNLTIAFLGFFLTGFLNLNAQERVYVPFFEVINMHPDYQYSTTKLFKTYVDVVNKYQVVLPDRFDSLSTGQSFESVKLRALQLNCKTFILAEFNRLGDVVIISFSMYNTADGNKLWQSTLKAQTPDDIDPIMEKMAINLGNQNAGSDDIYNVTSYDSKELNKIGANKYLGLSIGGGYAFTQNVIKNFPAGFGIVGSYDMRNIIFNIKAEAYFSDVRIYYFDIDAIYPFTTKKNSAFITGGMGYGGVSIQTKNQQINYYTNYRDSDGGLLLLAGGGYLFNRNSEVSLRFSGNVYVPMFRVNNTSPIGILFSTTLLFGR